MLSRPATDAAPARERIVPPLTEAATQALTLVLDAMRTHASNRALVDVCLDVRNTLLPALEADAKAPR